MDYSNKDFTNSILTKVKDLNGQVIRGSCFGKEVPDTKVFPADMRDVTFINCNLDNCLIPEGNTVIDCTTRRYKVQEDGEDWIIDKDLKPIEPVNKKAWIKLGRSIDPASIQMNKVNLSYTPPTYKEIA